MSCKYPQIVDLLAGNALALAFFQKIVGSLFKASKVKNEIIDLQDKKIAILREEKAVLSSEKSDLGTKVAALEKELDDLRPNTEAIDELQIDVLRLIFNQDLPIGMIARQLGIERGNADYHCVVLMRLGMIEPARGAMRNTWMGIDRPATFRISQKGRAYLIGNKLA